MAATALSSALTQCKTGRNGLQLKSSTGAAAVVRGGPLAAKMLGDRRCVVRCSAAPFDPTIYDPKVAMAIRAVSSPSAAYVDTSDPMQLLLKQRIVFLGGQVEDFMADALVSQLLLLDSQDPEKDIRMFINSPGGSVTAGMGIYDAMQLCQADVSTVVFGLAASMGAFLLCAGAKGKRYAMPNARVMIHQPLGGISGQADDMEIQAKEILFHKENLQNLMAYHTGQPAERIARDTDRDFYMSPKECVAFGMVDHIIGNDRKGIIAPDGWSQSVKFVPFEPEPMPYVKERMERWKEEMPDDLDMSKP